MDTIIVFLQVALAIVLAVAGIAKLRDLPGSRQAVRDFGVPEQWSTALGTALPVGESILAVLLLFEATSRWAALASALLFLVFVVAIGYNLRQGRQPDCHCFGQLHSEPAGWSTLVRNVTLASASLVVAWQGGRSISGWYADLSIEGQAGLIIGIAALVTFAAQMLFTKQLVKQHRDLLGRFESLALALAAGQSLATSDTPSNSDVRLATAFDIPDVNGQRLTLQSLLARKKPVLLLFTDPGCGPCNALMPDIGEWNRRFASDITIALISRGNVEDNRAKANAHGISRVGLQEWPEVSDPYGARATPTGVLVDADGIIRNPNANGRNQIRDLVSSTVDPRQPATLIPREEPVEYNPDGTIAESVFPDPSRTLTVGMPVPRLPLPDLEGNYFSLGDLRGQRLLMLFWNTDCSFCRAMLPDIKELEQEMESSPLKLVFSSAGTKESVIELGLRSPVLLDDELAGLSKAFGAPGTPSAIVIDEHGLVASEIMIGSDAILSFLDEQVEMLEPAV